MRGLQYKNDVGACQKFSKDALKKLPESRLIGVTQMDFLVTNR